MNRHFSSSNQNLQSTQTVQTVQTVQTAQTVVDGNETILSGAETALPVVQTQDATSAQQQGVRLTSLIAQEGAQLSALEESVLRMHHGISLRPEAALRVHDVNADVMEQIVDIEVKAFVETGWIDDVEPSSDAYMQVSDNTVTQQLVAVLKHDS